MPPLPPPASEGLADLAGNSTSDSAVSPEASGLPRVWQACLACRRKKIKCDGKHPCHNCNSRELTCEYPGAKDNASASRHYATSFEARFQQMESLCHRLEGLSGQLAHSIDALNRDSSSAASHDRAAEDPHHATRAPSAPYSRQRTPLPGLSSIAQTNAGPGMVPSGSHVRSVKLPKPVHLKPNNWSQSSDLSDSESSDDDGDSNLTDVAVRDTTLASNRTEPENHVGALVRDSYGRPRFIGGVANNLLVQAAQSLPFISTSSTPAARETPSSTPTHPVRQSQEGPELPMFVRGRVWRDLPFLPSPEQLPRPSKHSADILVDLYFTKLHHTFPVLFKPHFIQRYRQLDSPTTGGSGAISHDRRFMSVFFAVCACASSLLPQPASERGFSGIEYYERAMLLYYASTGEASLERVQCLALLSMCSAGWNTLTQSWLLAGQAVRAALDIGLHLSKSLIMPVLPSCDGPGSSEFLRQQISRRIWWCVYGLDRVTSICLGRPMAAQDEDCYCELPLNLDDEELEYHSTQMKQQPSSNIGIPYSNPPTPVASLRQPAEGFLAFARLIHIAGKIRRLNSPRAVRELASTDQAKVSKFVRRVIARDRLLAAWSESLPDSLRFSPDPTGKGGIGSNGPFSNGDLRATMAIIIFIIHAGSQLNLYRLSPYLATETGTIDAISRCVNAARDCIRAGGLVRDLVPPSHHLAFCIHYLTLSGVVLMRMPATLPNPETIADVERCISLLRDLEQRWTGALRSRDIIEQLLREYGNKTTSPSAVVGSQDVGTYNGYNQTPQQVPAAYDADGLNNHNNSKRLYNGLDGEMPASADLNGFWQIPGSELFLDSMDFGYLGGM